MEAFGVCDLDGTEGLTWQEIEACEVIHIMFFKILSTNFSTVNHTEFHELAFFGQPISLVFS